MVAAFVAPTAAAAPATAPAAAPPPLPLLGLGLLGTASLWIQCLVLRTAAASDTAPFCRSQGAPNRISGGRRRLGSLRSKLSRKARNSGEKGVVPLGPAAAAWGIGDGVCVRGS